MSTPDEVRMALEARLIEMGASVVGVHSLVVEDDIAHIGFDLDGDEPFFFEVPLPVAYVSRDDLSAFAHWLAAPTGRWRTALTLVGSHR